MAHVSTQAGIPGIVSLFNFRPETAVALNQLAEVLLRGPNSLPMSDRELIAAFVSNLNNCRFCTQSHSAFAASYLKGNEELVEQVKRDYKSAPISEKLKSLLNIASKVQGDARTVNDADIQKAKERGATETEIHDTVLIAAAFCMFNRYVDGLNSWTPDNPQMYREMAKHITTNGYLKPVTM